VTGILSTSTKSPCSIFFLPGAAALAVLPEADMVGLKAHFFNPLETRAHLVSGDEALKKPDPAITLRALEEDATIYSRQNYFCYGIVPRF